MQVDWRFFDRAAEVETSERQLPHWDQSGALTFITFRLADSMPISVIERWKTEQADWLARKQLKFDSIESFLQAASCSKAEQNQFRKFRLQRWHQNLDDCHGRCILRDPELATIVGNSLKYFEGQRYDLERFVIMPNHVHLLVQMRPGFGLRKQCESWLRFTGRKINERLGGQGEFWQSEPFDHIIRSEKQFRYLQTYISDNPVKAKLRKHEYLVWIRPA